MSMENIDSADRKTSDFESGGVENMVYEFAKGSVPEESLLNKVRLGGPQFAHDVKGMIVRMQRKLNGRGGTDIVPDDEATISQDRADMTRRLGIDSYEAEEEIDSRLRSIEEKIAKILKGTD